MVALGGTVSLAPARKHQAKQGRRARAMQAPVVPAAVAARGVLGLVVTVASRWAVRAEAEAPAALADKRGAAAALSAKRAGWAALAAQPTGWAVLVVGWVAPEARPPEWAGPDRSVVRVSMVAPKSFSRTATRSAIAPPALGLEVRKDDAAGRRGRRALLRLGERRSCRLLGRQLLRSSGFELRSVHERCSG